MVLPVKQYAEEQSNVFSRQIPAPVRGIKATSSLAGMAANECVYSFNLLPDDDGATVRQGYVEWANGWTGDIARTVIPFEGNESGDDKLFVSNNEGIWEVTASGTTSPNQEVTFGTATGDAGICSYVQFSNDGDERYLLVCCPVNGYYYWKQSTDTWTKAVEGGGAGEISGVDPAEFNFVMAWKERIWFIQKNTGKAWYLPTQQFAGTVAAFNFASQFASGGFLKAIHNWTIDGGDGVDDYLVAISSTGDVAIYAGTDPAAASTFAGVGTWQIGKTPEGARIAKDFGGELYILSIRGAVRASQLLQGNIEYPESYLTRDVAPFLNTTMNEAFDDFGWHIHAHPQTARLYVNAPPITNGEQWGFSYYFGTGAWGMVRTLPKGHTANWRNKVYWVDNVQNKIYKEEGAIDQVYLDPGTDGEPQPIVCDLLTAFSVFEMPGLNKRCQFITPMFLSALSPAYVVKPRYDYNVTELTTTADVIITDLAGVWNSGVWNTALWVDLPTAKQTLHGGGGGLGSALAVNLRLTSRAKETLVGFDVVFDVGGPL